MMILVTGGAASGKSEFAEKILAKLPGPHYYVATMHKTDDRETKERIQRHVNLRKKHDFITVEQETDVGEVPLSGGGSAMVECISNLLANEIFLAKRNDAAEYIVRQLGKLEEKGIHLVVVSNEVASDGGIYDDFTQKYIVFLQQINAMLARRAEYVVELVYGIPVFLKGNREELRKEDFLENI